MKTKIYFFYNKKNYTKIIVISIILTVFIFNACDDKKDKCCCNIFNFSTQNISCGGGIDTYKFYVSKCDTIKNTGIYFSAFLEQLGLEKSYKQFNIQEIDSNLLSTEIVKTKMKYIDCYFHNNQSFDWLFEDIWNAKSGIVSIRISSDSIIHMAEQTDIIGDTIYYDKYTVDIKLENIIYENNKGNRICIKNFLFKDVIVGEITFPGMGWDKK